MKNFQEMTVDAAKKLCRRHCQECGVDFDDTWKIYSGMFLDDAEAALRAAGVPQLLEKLNEGLRTSPH